MNQPPSINSNDPTIKIMEILSLNSNPISNDKTPTESFNSLMSNQISEENKNFPLSVSLENKNITVDENIKKKIQNIAKDLKKNSELQISQANPQLFDTTNSQINVDDLSSNNSTKSSPLKEEFKLAQTLSNLKNQISQDPLIKICKISNDLDQFNNCYQEYVSNIYSALSTTNLDRKEVEKTAKQMLKAQFEKKWCEIQISMNLIFRENEEERHLSISFRNIGIEAQLDSQVFNDFKSTFAKANKTIKGERHLEIACNFFEKLFLNFDKDNIHKFQLHPFKNKDNIKKLEQFNSGESETPYLVFDYIESLFLLGEILQELPEDLSNKHESKNPILAMTNQFIKKLGKIKEIKELEDKEKKSTINTYCAEFGRCITSYAKTLSKQLKEYLQQNEERENIKNFLILQLNKDTLDLLQISSIAENSAIDFERSIKGNYLSLSTDQSITSPTIPKNIETPEFLNHYAQKALLFLMENLNINKNKDLQKFNPINLLKNNVVIGSVFSQLESEWQTELKEKGKEAKMDGIFKLLPILRSFSQLFLLKPSKGVIFLEKILANSQNNKILTEFPLELDVKDADTKKLKIRFEQGNLIIQSERVTVLERTPGVTKSEDYAFVNCKITASNYVTIPIQDLQNFQSWKIETSVFIERPIIENKNLAFLKRYSALLATLETMGIPYQISLI